MPAPSGSLPVWATNGPFNDPGADWDGQPRRDDTGLAALAAEGFVPSNDPDVPAFDTEPLNAWLGLASEWIVHFDTELANVIAGGYADGSATDSTLVDALDTKGNLAGGNTWTGTQTFSNAIDVNAASTVDAVMTFSVRPVMPSWNGPAGGVAYSGAGLQPHATVPFYAQYVEAGGGSGPNHVVTIHLDLVQSCGIIDLHYMVWNNGANTITSESIQIVFHSPIGSPPTIDTDVTNLAVNGGATSVSFGVDTVNNEIRIQLTTSGNGTFNVAGWYTIVRANTTQ